MSEAGTPTPYDRGFREGYYRAADDIRRCQSGKCKGEGVTGPQCEGCPVASYLLEVNGGDPQPERLNVHQP